MKFGITIALPGTPMFGYCAEDKRIRSYDWDECCVHSTHEGCSRIRHLESRDGCSAS